MWPRYHRYCIIGCELRASDNLVRVGNMGHRFPPELGRVHSHFLSPPPFHPRSLNFLYGYLLPPPLCYSSLPFPCPSIRNPLPHPSRQIQIGDLGERCKLPQRGPGRSSVRQRICIYFRFEIAAGGDEFQSWFTWPYIWASPTASQNLVGSTMGWTL